MNDRAPAHGPVDASRAMEVARDVLRIEARSIEAVASRLSGAFVDAVSRVRDCRGRVVVSGIGKSGHVARKLAATLASTGTPAFFVHAAEANHGDLGMITPDDVVIMLSNSGETDELVTLAPHVRRQGAALIAMTGNERVVARAGGRHPSRCRGRQPKPARSASRPPRARPRCWRSATRSRSRCSTRADSRPMISPARIRAARSAGDC